MGVQWVMDTSVPGTIKIHKGQSFENAMCRDIYPTTSDEYLLSEDKVKLVGDQINLKMVSNRQFRLVGYLIKYNTQSVKTFVSDYNYFHIHYSEASEISNPKLHILLEDGVIRLLMDTHLNGMRDYRVVCKWRENNAAQDVQEE